MPDNRNELGEAVRARRHQLGWTTKELAKRSSLGESTIRQIENVTGTSSPRLPTLEILSRALGLTPNHLGSVLNGTQQDDVPLQVVDEETLLPGLNELRRRLDEIEADNLERHQRLERRLDNLGAMLKHLNPDVMYGRGPDINIKHDDGEQSPS